MTPASSYKFSIITRTDSNNAHHINTAQNLTLLPLITANICLRCPYNFNDNVNNKISYVPIVCHWPCVCVCAWHFRPAYLIVETWCVCRSNGETLIIYVETSLNLLSRLFLYQRTMFNNALVFRPIFSTVQLFCIIALARYFVSSY